MLENFIEFFAGVYIFETIFFRQVWHLNVCFWTLGLQIASRYLMLENVQGTQVVVVLVLVWSIIKEISIGLRISLPHFLGIVMNRFMWLIFLLIIIFVDQLLVTIYSSSSIMWWVLTGIIFLALWNNRSRFDLFLSERVLLGRHWRNTASRILKPTAHVFDLSCVAYVPWVCDVHTLFFSLISEICVWCTSLLLMITPILSIICAAGHIIMHLLPSSRRGCLLILQAHGRHVQQVLEISFRPLLGCRALSPCAFVSHIVFSLC